jgi:hypothetical protein
VARHKIRVLSLRSEFVEGVVGIEHDPQILSPVDFWRCNRTPNLIADSADFQSDRINGGCNPRPSGR